MEVLLAENVLLFLWKLVYIICLNGISFLVLTSIYNTLLQANGLIPLSQGGESDQMPNTEEKPAENLPSSVSTEI